MTENDSTGQIGNDVPGRRGRTLQHLNHDRSIAIFWSVILVWGAVVLALEMMLPSNIDWWDSGGVFLSGLGLIILSEGLYRFIKAEYHRRILLRFVLGVVFLGAGLANMFSFQGNMVLIIILLLIAGAILINVFIRNPVKR